MKMGLFTQYSYINMNLTMINFNWAQCRGKNIVRRTDTKCIIYIYIYIYICLFDTQVMEHGIYIMIR